MTTPSSSTTTPSPQLRYMQSGAVSPPQPVPSNGVESNDREERELAVQKFLARAELSKLTRGLRTRLSYATYKATHNLAHTTLHDLEAKTDTQTALYRPPPGSTRNYYNNPATQGISVSQYPSSRNAARKGSMAPPPPLTASATQSLFASILAPPPTKRARTIHNPQDPPVPAPAKPKPISPPKKTSKAKAKAAASSSQLKSRARKDKDDKGKRKESASSARAISRVSSSNSQDMMEDSEMDMKAAATLTSLLRSRPSMSAAASSPRSSISATSDPGSLHSFSHFAQSSARTTTAPTSALPSNENSFSISYGRSTPPPMSAETQSLVRDSDVRFQGSSTPKAQGRALRRPGEPATPQAPTDSEAADLMLYLATSPSPARPTHSRDRSLGGSSSMPGRVLFGSDERPSTNPRALRREYTGSFSSTMTVATELTSESGYQAGTSEDSIMHSPSPSRRPPGERHDEPMNLDVPQMPTITPPTPTDPQPGHLLPVTLHSSQSSVGSSSQVEPSAPPTLDPRFSMAAPPTPGFNFHEFLNVSPSPAVTAGSTSRLPASRNAEIGRRLFEGHSGTIESPQDPSSLGAGIDLAQS
ncbi:hypothetical protein QCA50_014448 [Cerrena zonata]|uniref:Proteophosphoglycan ppg4 n=1 Tax=Cerrena zonata TaxID=2478898 RepID=A0AAW0FNR9_9APHY